MVLLIGICSAYSATWENDETTGTGTCPECASASIYEEVVEVAF